MNRAKSLVVVLSVIGLSSCSGSEGPTRPSSTDVEPSPAVTTAQGLTEAAAVIVFNRWASETDRALLKIDLEGTNEQLILEVREGAALSPDGTRFVSAVEAPDGRIAPAMFDFDGSGFAVLPLPDPTINLAGGTWFPDGTRLLTGAWDNSDKSRDGLYSYRADDGGDLVRLTDPSPSQDYEIAFSPDGTKILFTRAIPPYDHSGPMKLMTMNVDGSGMQRVNPPGTMAGLTSLGIVSSASWSPDGRVAFVASDGSYWDDRRAVFVANADGTGAERITSWNETLSAQWSPDGEWIAYDRATPSGPHDLFIVHPNGTGPTRVTSSENDVFSFGPTWSPDGTQLLFVRGDDFTATDLWVVNADGTGPAQVTHEPSEYNGYGWLPQAG
jgi:TolB protein